MKSICNIGVHPIFDQETNSNGVMIITESKFEPFLSRETIAIIGDEDWKRFCPLKHIQVGRILKELE